MAIRYNTCIKCGSKDIAKIIYGLPVPKLYSLEEERKVVLAGCCILIESKTFPLIDARGRTIGEHHIEEYIPEYYCHTCEFKWNKELATYYAYSQMERLKVSVGSFSEGHKLVEIDFVDKVVYFKLSFEEEFKEKKLQLNQLVDLINRLKEIHLIHWKNNYSDPNILDGTQWGIEIKYPTRTKKKYGSNQYPKQWKEFTNLLEELTSFKFS